jgi:hypothetical protein
VERDALAAEAERLATATVQGAPAVEIVDRATRACVARLPAVGLLQRPEGRARVLHRAPGIVEAAA